MKTENFEINNNHNGRNIVGNRRSEEELEALKILNNKTAFKLREDQYEFKGTKEQLEFMQNAERAYISGHPIMTDEEWDILKEKHNYKETLTSVSPSGRNWIKFNSPLPSLNKGGSLEDLDKFLNKFDKDQKFICEVKLDGLTSNLKYIYIPEKEKYELDSISSRGNGRFGLELNPYALSGVKTNFPKTISEIHIRSLLGYLPNEFEIRGEAVIPKNERTYKKYGKDAVWRNIAAGIFNRKIPSNIKGLIEYCQNELNIDFDFNNRYEVENIKYLILKPEYLGRRCNNPDILETARLFASLSPSEIKFTRGMYVIVREDNVVQICEDDNDVNCRIIEQFTCEEELDTIMYSISINGSNIDLNDLITNENEKIFNCIGFKTIKDVHLERYPYNALNYSGINETFRITNNRDSIKEAINEFYGINPETNKRDKGFPRLRNLYEYACDGVVIKPCGSNKKTQNVDLRLGRNNKIVQPEYPEDQIAIKLLSEVVKVKLDHIERKTTSLGNITCTGILDRGYKTESGAIVSNVNLHNPEWLKRNNWIKEGETYDLCMSLDMIPVLMNPNL